MKVLLLSKYGRKGASSRVRSYQYLPYLRAHGVEIDTHALLDDDYLRSSYAGRAASRTRLAAAALGRLAAVLTSRRYDLVWLEKELFPWAPALVERVLSLVGTPYVVDYDDAIFHNYDRHRSSAVRWLLGRKIDAVMRRAALVIVGNEYLGARARAAGASNVEYLPSVVDVGRYGLPDRPPDGVFTVGWIGSPSTTKYLLQPEVSSALHTLCAQGNTRLVFVGATDVDWRSLRPELRRWSEAAEPRDVADFDVGIMPLLDDHWTRGKCGYKLIQYMAAAKAVVASPVGVNRKIVEHGVTGFLAEGADKWIESLTHLRDSVSSREAMGRRGRDKAARLYSLDVAAPRLAMLLARAATASHGP